MFKVGYKVKCINALGKRFIKDGGVYEVARVCGIYCSVYEAVGVDYRQSRFIKVIQFKGNK